MKQIENNLLNDITDYIRQSGLSIMASPYYAQGEDGDEFHDLVKDSDNLLKRLDKSNITLNNYFEESFAIWREAEPNNPILYHMAIRRPDHTSNSGSTYYYVEIDNEMYIGRSSNHWGKVNNCQWYLIGKYNLNYDCIVYTKRIIAVCKLSDFKPIKENPYKDYEYEFFIEE